MNNIRALLVDDEIGAIQTLQKILHLYCQDVEVVGYARSVPEAVRQVKQHQPNLVFLDIEMTPAGNGFDFIEQTRENDFGVIFTTAYPQYAIQAIKSIQPWYYLVKPFSLADLLQAVEVAATKIQEIKDRANEETGRFSITLPIGRKGNIILKTDDILYCKADQSVSEVYVARGGEVEKIVVFCSLGNLEKRLSGAGFFRTHHSYLVNISRIEGYAKTGRCGTAQFAKNHIVSISVSKMKEFEFLVGTYAKNPAAEPEQIPGFL